MDGWVGAGWVSGWGKGREVGRRLGEPAKRDLGTPQAPVAFAWASRNNVRTLKLNLVKKKPNMSIHGAS